MARPITFKVLRFALIPFEQTDIEDRPLPSTKGRAIERALPIEAPPRFFTYWNRDHALVGFGRVRDPEWQEDRFFIGRLAKKRQTGIGQLKEQDFVEITTDDWLPIWVLIDVIEQYIAVEMHARFGQLNNVIKTLQTGLTEPIEERFRHEVIISPVTDPRAFWEVVERSPEVYRAHFRFVSPNFLNTPGRFRDLLGDWRNVFNQTETDVDLKNEEGELKLPTDVLSEPVEYISAGEGDWILEVWEDGSRKSISSRDSSKSFRLEVPRASHPQEKQEAEPRKDQKILRALLDLIRGSR